MSKFSPNTTDPVAQDSSTVVAHDPEPTPQAAETLRVLRQAVAQALDRKRRLGHYAVIWQDGKVVDVAPESLPSMP